MSNGTVNSCTGSFYDSGGPTGNYANGEDFVFTICPDGGSGSGGVTEVEFLTWNVQVGFFDSLIVHNGDDVSAPILDIGTGANSLAGAIYSGGGATGCLTFRWSSNNTVTAAGWEARLINGPDAGDDAVTSVCDDQGNFVLTSILGGNPDPGGTWTDPSNNPHSNTFNPSSDLPGVYTYTVAGAVGCNDATATVTVSVLSAPDPGSNSALTVCETDPAVNLFQQLGGTPDIGGTWTSPAGAHSGTLDPATDGSGVYTYTVTGAPPCTDESAVVLVTVNTQPDAGLDGTVTVCSDDAAFNLFAELDGSPEPGGTWTDPDGNPHPTTYTPGVSDAGVYTYTITASFPCTNQSATVTVTENQAVNAGINNAISVCSDAATFTLISQLGGSPDPGGVWTFNGTVVSDNFDPSSDPSGTYTYTLVAVPPCVNDDATVDITVNPATDAGIDGTASVCSNDPAFQLIDSLNGSPQPIGSWQDPNGNPFSGTFQPGISLGGVYTYRVEGILPCADDISTVTVSQTIAPNAGNNTSSIVCSSDALFNLFDLLGGSPDAGGTWTDPIGNPFTDPFDPSVDISGVYTYTVNGTGPCADASATVAITVNQAPNAGVDASLDICSDTSTVDLIDALGGSPQATGTWTDPNGNPFGGSLDPLNDLSGTYTYTVTGVAPCVDAAATVIVSITIAPEAGLDGSITVCSDGVIVPLFNELGGSPDLGGQWFRPNGNAFNGNYNPANQAGGSNLYVVSGAGPCANDSSIVQVIRNIAPDAGTPGSITLCETNAQFDLINALGGSPMGSGTWEDPNGDPVPGGSFNPGSDLAGIYTYTVPGIAPCVDDVSTVQVNVSLAPDAGNSVNLTICGDDAPFNLFDELGGTPDAGGFWEFNSNPHSVIYDPSVDGSGVYTYTVLGPTPCADASASVIVLEVEPVSAGTDNTLTICESDPPADLFSLLGPGADIGGSWNGPGGPGFSGVFDPQSDPAGQYTYTVSGTSPCSDANAIITVTLLPTPLSGTPGSLSVCPDLPQVDLFTVLTGSFDLGGNWSDDDNSGQLAGSIFSPIGLSNGDYEFTYTVNGNGSCAAQSTTVTVTIVPALNAGQNNSLSICSSEQNFNLFTALAGTPQPGGQWNDDDNSGALTAGVLNASSLGGSTFSFTYKLVGTQGCASDSAIVQISIIQEANAGGDNSFLTCSSFLAFDMTPQLSGTPTTGGIWLDPNGAAHSTIFDPSSDQGGVYSYVISGSGPCENDTTELDITLVQAPDAGGSNSVSVCSDQGAFNMIDSLLGTPDVTGVWDDPNAAVHPGVFFPGSDQPGSYLYAVPGTAPCPQALSVLTVNVDDPPSSGSSTSVTFCSQGSPVLLSSYMTGADPGGTWTDPNGQPFNGVYVPDTSTQGTYVYTVGSAGSCNGSSSTLDVFVNEQAQAGTSASANLCATSGITDLFSLLTGSPQAGGVWTNPAGGLHSGQFNAQTDAPGNYKYKVSGVLPCSDDSSVVTVSVSSPPSAGSSALLQLCDNSAPVILLQALGGTPDSGGDWTDDNGNPVSGFYLPGFTPPGVYTYTVSNLFCPSEVATVTVSESTFLSAGSSGNLTVCETEGSVDLFAQLSGADAGGTWTNPSGGVHSGTFSPSVDDPGPYQYLASGQSPCAADSAVVFMNVDTVPDPGISTLYTICSDTNSFLMTTALSGTPDLLGNWQGPSPSNALMSGIYQPGITSPGTYTYTVPPNGTCASAQSLLTIVENQAPFAGNNSLEVLCSSDIGNSASLLDFLDGGPDAGGSWLDPALNPHSGVFLVGVDSNGVYTYVVDGNSPCVNDTATLQISITIAPNAGISSVQNLCESDPAQSLTSMLAGTPDLNGQWFNPSNVAVPIPIFDPGLDQPGTYTYFVQATPPCVVASASVLINVVDSVYAGMDSSITTCGLNTSVDLNDALQGGGVNGSWVDLDGTGALSGAIFDASTVPLGVYRFGYVVQGGAQSCPNDTAFITVDVAPDFNAGNDTLITACESDPTIDLFQLLGSAAQPGGSWVDLGNSGQLGVANGLFVPSLASTGVFWNFRYVIQGVGGCTSDSSTISVFIVEGPDAGFALTCERCTTDPAFSLFDCLVGNDVGGTWYDTTGVMLATDSIAPLVDTTITAIYVVPGTSNCPSDSVVLTVQIDEAPSAGLSNIIQVCSNSVPFDMTDSLLGNPDSGGQWFDASGVNPVANTFFPSSTTPGFYNYSVQGSGGCGFAVASLNVTVDQAPDAGTNGTVDTCSNVAPFALFFQLGSSGDFGGQWFDPVFSPVPSGLLDPSIALSGDYTYVVSASGACINDSAQVAVQISQQVNAGDSTVIDTCLSTQFIDLDDVLNGNPDPNGSWIALQNGIQTLIDPSTNVLSVAGLSAAVYDFRYVINSPAPCESDSALLSLDFTTGGAQAGNDGNIDLCSNESFVDLNNYLSANADPGGVWAVTLGNGACLNGNILDAQCALLGGNLSVRYVVVEPGCGSDTSFFDLEFVDAPQIGQDTILSVCENGLQFDLLGLLPGLQDSTGFWVGPLGPITSTVFTPGISKEGQYYYIVSSPPPCGLDTSEVLVNVDEPLLAGYPDTLNQCVGAFFADVSSYTVSQGGTWIDVANTGQFTNGIFDYDGLPSGLYIFHYVVSNPGCGVDSVTLGVNLMEAVQIQNLAFNCNMDDWTYSATFDLLYGNSDYSVSGIGGTLFPGSPGIPYTFETDEIQLHEPMQISVEAGFCGVAELDTIGSCDFGSLVFVPESFSPNGDGINDFFEIQGIEGFPFNTIEIYNRWGDLVYKAAGYDNREVVWEGRAENALIPGEIPAGTYYYVLDLGMENSEQVKGFVYVVK